MSGPEASPSSSPIARARRSSRRRVTADTTAPGRALRYLEWTRDPDPADTTYEVDYVVALREGDEPLRVVQDHHVEGLFARDEWLAWLEDVGFVATAEPVTVPDGPAAWTAFMGRRPAGAAP